MKIRNEDEAWELLERLVIGEEVDLDNVKLKGWPVLTVYVPSGNASLSIEMMESLIGYQKQIYKSATLLTRSTDDLRKLTHFDKENFSFRVKVKKGSTDATSKLSEIFTEIGKEMVTKMTPTQTFIAVLAAALLLAGTTMFKAHLANKLEGRKLDDKKGERKDFLDQTVRLSELDVERQRIMEKAIMKSAVLGRVRDLSEDAASELIAIASNEGGAELVGVEVTERLADAANKSKRRTSESVTLSGEYKIRKVDATNEDGFKVQLEDSGGKIFTAGLADKLIIGDTEDVIQKATFLRKNITAKIKAKDRQGEIADAEILSASLVRPSSQ